MAAHGIDYLPGAAELGDFDPTSTTIAFAPGGELSAAARRRWSPRHSSGTGASSSTGETAGGPGRTTRPTSCATWARSSAWAGASGRTSCSPSSWPVVVRRRGTSGPRSSAGIRASRASSATCRTAGSPRTSSAPRWICSPSSADGDDALVLARRRSAEWLAGSGVAVKGLRTRVRTAELFAASATEAHLVRVEPVARGASGWIRPRLAGPPAPAATTRVNGKPARWEGGELRDSRRSPPRS